MIPAGFPLVGHLRFTRPRDHLAACREIFWTYFLGFMPIWIALLIQFLTRGSGYVGEAVRAQVDSGSVFLVSAAMFSSYVYLLMNDDAPSKLQPFPHRSAFALLFIIMIVAWAVVEGISALSVSLHNSIPINANAIRTLTITSGIVALVALYLVFVYKSAIGLGYGAISREDTEHFESDWRDRDD